MKNSIFILSYDRDSVSDMTKFHDGITTTPLVKNWSHYINSSYLLVANTQKASVLAKSLKDTLGDVPYFVMEVNLSNYWGRLPQKAWDWIEKVIGNSEGGISFDSFLGISRYRLYQISKKAKSFKIGKTSQPLEDRRQQQDYRNLYPHIEVLFASGNKKLVDIAEAEIIDASIDNPKCDNEKDGVRSLNDTMASSDKYMVYVVWR